MQVSGSNPDVTTMNSYTYIKDIQTGDPKEYRRLLREEFIPAMVAKGLEWYINSNKDTLFKPPKEGDGFSCYPEIAVVFQ